MNVTAHKTKKVEVGDDLFETLDTYLPELQEKTVVIITSKIISICKGNVIKNDGNVDKEKLIKETADEYFEDENLKFWGIVIPTITQDVLIANAGIDESNANGYYILWPKNLDQITNDIWNYLRKKYNVKNLGVIITDSHVVPMRYGTLGIGISWCGFEATEDYRGKPDIFGKPLEITQKNIFDALATSAVVVMGEGEEQTPIATITDVPFVTFQDHPTTQEERDNLKIEKEKDIYGKLLTSVKWEKGGNK
jgi:dihydrofolate synthase / folylpolyglutamate synthase